MLFSDAVEVAGVRETRDGYWIASVLAAKANNVQIYSGAEVGRPDLPTVAVFRPRDEIFRPESLATYAHKPVCVGHPRGGVDATSWKDVAAGAIGGDIIRDGDAVRVSLALMDASAIEAVRNGVRQISMGYECQLEFADGVTEDGTPYQATQRDIRINHAAIVPVGRAGPECRIGDVDAHKPTPSTAIGERAVPDESLRPLVVDGLTIPCTQQSAEAITKLQKQLADAMASKETILADAEKAHKAVVDGLEGQIAALKSEQARLADAHAGEIAGLKAAHEQAISAKEGEIAALRVQTSDEAVEARVAARSALVAQAKRLLGDAFDPAGKTDADIRKAAVIARLGDKVPADAGDSYMVAAFDTLLAVAPANAPAKPDPLRQVIHAGGGSNGAPAVNDANAPGAAYRAHLERTQNAWKHAAGKEIV